MSSGCVELPPLPVGLSYFGWVSIPFNKRTDALQRAAFEPAFHSARPHTSCKQTNKCSATGGGKGCQGKRPDIQVITFQGRKIITFPREARPARKFVFRRLATAGCSSHFPPLLWSRCSPRPPRRWPRHSDPTPSLCSQGRGASLQEGKSYRERLPRPLVENDWGGGNLGGRESRLWKATSLVPSTTADDAAAEDSPRRVLMALR